MVRERAVAEGAADPCAVRLTVDCVPMAAVVVNAGANA
jgi:hypothetical protein